MPTFDVTAGLGQITFGTPAGTGQTESAGMTWQTRRKTFIRDGADPLDPASEIVLFDEWTHPVDEDVSAYFVPEDLSRAGQVIGTLSLTGTAIHSRGLTNPDGTGETICLNEYPEATRPFPLKIGEL